MIVLNINWYCDLVLVLYSVVRMFFDILRWMGLSIDMYLGVLKIIIFKK